MLVCVKNKQHRRFEGDRLVVYQVGDVFDASEAEVRAFGDKLEEVLTTENTENTEKKKSVTANTLAGAGGAKSAKEEKKEGKKHQKEKKESAVEPEVAPSEGAIVDEQVDNQDENQAVVGE